MASTDDVNSTLQGVVRNLGQWLTAIGALSTATLGANIGTTNSPKPTIITALGTTSLLVVAANSARLGITFHSPNTAANSMWVVPSTLTAVIGRGLLIAGGSTVSMPSTCGWNAIATTGSTNILTILEFV